MMPRHILWGLNLTGKITNYKFAGLRPPVGSALSSCDVVKKRCWWKRFENTNMPIHDKNFINSIPPLAHQTLSSVNCLSLRIQSLKVSPPPPCSTRHLTSPNALARLSFSRISAGLTFKPAAKRQQMMFRSACTASSVDDSLFTKSGKS